MINIAIFAAISPSIWRHIALQPYLVSIGLQPRPRRQPGRRLHSHWSRSVSSLPTPRVAIMVFAKILPCSWRRLTQLFDVSANQVLANAVETLILHRHRRDPPLRRRRPRRQPQQVHTLLLYMRYNIIMLILSCRLHMYAESRIVRSRNLYDTDILPIRPHITILHARTFIQVDHSGFLDYNGR
jgi:hypothetical protein